jgi:hypothetical protein
MNVSVTIGSISAALSGALMRVAGVARRRRRRRAAPRARQPRARGATRVHCGACDGSTDCAGAHAAHTPTHPKPQHTSWSPCVSPGVAGHAHRHWGSDYTEGALYVRVISMFMLTTSIVIACWAGFNFNNRANMLQ